jgi:beta-phosphoglucomutase-like phosphatase (HAD superfamily)
MAEEYDMSYAFITAGQTLLDLVDVDISGRTFNQGKPHPEIFLTACRELGVTPETCFVVEDAVSGVTAAKAGGMAALAIARTGEADRLHDAGADLVLTTLDEVDRKSLRDGRLERVAPVAAHAP